MDTLWDQFDRVVVFDTETTGIDPRSCRIIEIGAVVLTPGGEGPSLDRFLHLPPGMALPEEIVGLTGITDAMLLEQGVAPRQAAEEFCRLWAGAERPLLAAYNAQFDLNFLYGLLRDAGLAGALRPPRFLDLLTVYRDRRDYPHRLCNAIAAYGLEERVENSHRAVDDARAAAVVMEAMAKEREDLLHYVDLFGVHPKYGVSGRRISSVTYRVQPYQRGIPLYQRTGE